MKSIIPVDEFGMTERNGQPVVYSRKLAEMFGREHRHVLDAIRKTTEPKCGLSEEFISDNFTEIKYKDSTGRWLPEYLLTWDGFSIVVMGFSGKKAMKFKEAYIKRFNQMADFIGNLLSAKMEYPQFTDAIMQAHEEPKHYHFSNEVDMINRIVTGKSAKQIRDANGMKQGESIRPCLTGGEIEAVLALQRADIGLVLAGMGYEVRKQMLQAQFQRMKFKVLKSG